MSVLSCEDIQSRMVSPDHLITEYQCLDEQLQPNGFDLTLRQVARFTSAAHPAKITLETPQRLTSHSESLSFSDDGFLDLCTGPYLITFNEIVNLPPYLMALGKPRSSLLRSGLSVHGAVWDAGYSGRSQALLTVYNPHGCRLMRNARVLQLIFFTLDVPTQQGYTGLFQGENIQDG